MCVWRRKEGGERSEMGGLYISGVKVRWEGERRRNMCGLEERGKGGYVWVYLVGNCWTNPGVDGSVRQLMVQLPNW